MITYLYYCKKPLIFVIILILFFVCKKYFKFIKSLFDRFILRKNNKINSKVNKKIEVLKDFYEIKSTEKTNIYLKYIINKPSIININNIDNLNIKYLNLNIKNLYQDKNAKKIIETYVYNKKIFIDLFYIDNKLCINNLKDFYIFHKKYSQKKINNKYNIFFKFYCTRDDPNEYLYICVDNNNLIKIKKYEEFDKICDLIKSGRNIFLIHENYNKYFISYGGFVEFELNCDDIKNIFFTNTKIDNKNYNILNKFKKINVFFYVCTELSIMR